MIRKALKTTFAGGELAPALEGRVDISRYQTSVQKASNFYVTRFGAISNRPGTEYIGDSLATSGKACRLIPFQFSVTQTYILEFTDDRMRVVKDGSIVLTSRRSATYRWTASGSGTNEYYCELSGGGDPSIPGAVEVWENDVQIDEGTAGSLTAGTWDYADNDSLGYSTIYIRLSDNADPDSKAAGYVESDYQLDTNIAESALDEMTFAQSADTLFLAGAFFPRKITRTADDAWTSTQISFTPNQSAPVDIDVVKTGFTATARDVFYQISAYDPDLLESLPCAEEKVQLDLTWPSAGRIDLYWNSIRSATFKWTASGSGTSEYYLELAAGGDPSMPTDIGTVYEDKAAMTEATAGSLTAGQWDYADNDSLGYSTIYVRLSDSTDPDSKAVGYLTYKRTSEEQYSVYKNYRGDWGWLGTVQTPWFLDDNVEPNVTITPKVNETIFDSSDSDTNPYAVGIYKQRLFYARSNNNPQKIWASQLNDLTNFSKSAPLSAEDPIKVTLRSGGRVDEIRHLVPIDKLMVLTTGSEWTLTNGDNSDALTPFSVVFKGQGYSGCSSTVQPLTIDNECLFVQRNNRDIRSMRFRIEAENYLGDILTYMVPHLFENVTIVDWCYQQHPQSLVWIVLSDGSLVTMTYIPDQEMVAFTRGNMAATDSEINGKVKACASITTTGDDEVYFVVERIVNSTTKYFLEKMSSREFDDVRDAKFLDCALSYNPEKTITNVAVTATEITVTVTAHGYSNGDYVLLDDVVGITSTEAHADYSAFNDRYYKVANKATNTFEIQTLPEVVSLVNSSYKWTASGSGTSEYYLELAAGGNPNVIEPSSVQENGLDMVVGTAGSLTAGKWDYADNDSLGYSTIYVRLSDSTDPDTQASGYVTRTSSTKLTSTHFTGTYISGGVSYKCTKTVTGLDHLEGETVVALADGNVIENLTVSSGSVTLGTENPGFGKVHAGLAYICDLQTLRLETGDSGNNSLQGVKKRIPEVFLRMHESSGGKMGPDTDTLTRIKWRQNEEWLQPNALKTEDVEHKLPSTHNREGRFVFRQDEPLPTTIMMYTIFYDTGDVK